MRLAVNEADFVQFYEDYKKSLKPEEKDKLELIAKFEEKLNGQSVTSTDLLHYKWNPAADTYDEYANKSMKYLSKLFKNNLSQKILVAGHSTLTKIVTLYSLNKDINFDTISKVSVKPGSWVHFKVYEDGSVELLETSKEITLKSNLPDPIFVHGLVQTQQ